MQVIIAGSRGVTDYDLVCRAVSESGYDITCVLSGTARGVDQLGERYAKANNIDIERYPADWKNLDVEGAVVRSNRYGNYNARAGHNRNEQMGRDAEALIAIWDGQSAGTKNMIDFMHKQRKPVYVMKL